MEAAGVEDLEAFLSVDTGHCSLRDRLGEMVGREAAGRWGKMLT